MCYRRRMLQINLAFFPFIVCSTFLSSFISVLILLHFSHDRSKWFSPSLCSPTFQNLTSWDRLDHSRPVTGLLYLYLFTFKNTPDICDQLSELCIFQHHIQLCSKCSTFQVSSSNLCPIEGENFKIHAYVMCIPRLVHEWYIPTAYITSISSDFFPNIRYNITLYNLLI